MDQAKFSFTISPIPFTPTTTTHQLATGDHISIKGEHTCIATSDWWHYTIHYKQGTGSGETWSDCISTQVNNAGDDSSEGLRTDT